jgi:hypothetical protein
MRFRKLRMAWSVACGIVFVMFIALWVRSYWIAHGLVYTRSTTIVLIYASAGTTGGSYISLPRGSRIGNKPGFEWHYNAVRPDPDLKPFMWDRRPQSLSVRVPAWCCASFFVLLAALPWIRFRFTTRTLLIATTLVAVVLGLIALSMR